MFLVDNTGKIIEVANTEFYVDANGKYAELLPASFYVDENGKYAELVGGSPFAARRLVVVTESQGVFYSDDGVEWNNKTGGAFISATTTGERIYATRLNVVNPIQYSLDGETWTATTQTNEYSHTGDLTIAYFEELNYFYASGKKWDVYTRQVFYSTNGGETWGATDTMPSSYYSPPEPMVYDTVNKIIFAVARSGFYKAKVIPGTIPAFSYLQAHANSPNLRALATLNGTTISFKKYGGPQVVYTKDGETVTVGNMVSSGDSVNNESACAIAGNDKFVYVYEGNPYYSSDGLNWSKGNAPSDMGSNPTGLAFDGKCFYFVSTAGKVFYSVDGITWTALYNFNKTLNRCSISYLT